LATAAPAPVIRGNAIQFKHIMWLVFAVMALYVLLTRDWTLLDSHPVLCQRHAPIPWLMMGHGIPGALVLGVFQFSTRLRQRFLKLHRILEDTANRCNARM
jgi:hypothetical protein